MTIDEAVKARENAAMRLHWHLSKAAASVLSGCCIGGGFDEEMALVELARQDWNDAQSAIFSAQPTRDVS